MKTLIIPDVHHKTNIVDAIVALESPDHVICLGDYFDDFHDSPEQSILTAKWLKARLSDGWTMLLGNHDLPYAYDAFCPNIPNPFRCSGYSIEKSRAVNSVFPQAGWLSLPAYHKLDRYILSHAGIHPSFAYVLSLDPIEFLRSTLIGGVYSNALSAVSRKRGGHHPTGGILWLDYSEFIPSPNLNQIFGHSPSRLPRLITAPSYNLCLDTHLHHYSTITDSDLPLIKETP